MLVHVLARFDGFGWRKGSPMNATKLTALALLANMIHALSHVATFVNDLFAIEVVLVEDVTAPIALVKENLGRTLERPAGDQRLTIELPDLDGLAFAYDELPEARANTSPLRNFAIAVGGITNEGLAAGGTVTTDHLVACFKALCQRDQPAAREAFRWLPRALGIAHVSEVMARMHLDTYYPNWRNPLAVIFVTMNVFLERPGKRPIKPQHEYEAMLQTAVKQAKGAVQLLHFLRADGTPVVREVIQQETPPQEGDAPEEEAPGRRIKPRDRRIDLDRDRFYREELGCEGPFETEGVFHTRGYVHYRYTATSGVVVAIYDNRWVGNAAYLFVERRSGETADTNWREYARRSRRALIALLEGDAAQHGPVLDRFEHVVDTDWRQPIRVRLGGL